MKKNAILLSEITPDQLKNMFCEGVKSQLEAFKKDFYTTAAQDDLLTREQTAHLLQIHETTLWHWTNKGRVTAYSIAGKRYYKRSEILGALTEVKK